MDLAYTGSVECSSSRLAPIIYKVATPGSLYTTCDSQNWNRPPWSTSSASRLTPLGTSGVRSQRVWRRLGESIRPVCDRDQRTYLVG